MKNNIINNSCLASMGVVFLLLSACQKPDAVRTSRDKPEKTLSATFIPSPGAAPERINTIRLFKDTVYNITENFTREAGEQLVVDAGTVLKIVPGVGINIAQGAIIAANGTPTEPIIFTSALPAGSNANYWNGITIDGKSSNNNTGLTGDPADNSGSLQFVRIEFGALTMNAVGNGTVINHVEVSYANQNAAFTFSGGTVNVKYLVSYAAAGGQDFYISNGYTGKMQFLLAHRHPFFGSSSSFPSQTLAGLYISNNEFNPVDARPETRPLISNLTILGPNAQASSAPAYADTLTPFNAAGFVTSANALFNIRNSAILGFPVGGWLINDYYTAYNVDFELAEFTSDIVTANDPDRIFYVRNGVYPPYDRVDFIEYMLETRFKNKVFNQADEFLLQRPFDYNSPSAALKPTSSLLTGADFSGQVYTDNFFDKVSFVGAFGQDNWTEPWANFTPLKTAYNAPR
jgi:hypothetical protein